MVVFHYPPAYGSGVQRALAFTRHLRDFGWEPTVLSIRPSAYEQPDPDRLQDIPEGVEVVRAWGLDSARQLAIFGRHLPASALPDRWITWWAGAVVAGMRLLRRSPYDVIFSTFPIATAHVIGATLQSWSGVPWIAEFRDPMAQDDYPQDPRTWRSYRRVEEKTVRGAAGLIFTTEGAVNYYRRRYPEIPASRFSVIENGYDEDVFSAVEANRPERGRSGRLTLVHSGLLYPWERDPKPFFAALARLRDAGAWVKHPLRVVLRATGFEERYRAMIADYGVGDIVELAPRLGYRDALAEMFAADGLLLFQAANSNFQIPAKSYEYLRAGRPVLALVDPGGDTAALLRSTGGGRIVPIDDEVAIAAGLQSFVADIEAGAIACAAATDVRRYSRRNGTERLAALFDAVADRGHAGGREGSSA